MASPEYLGGGLIYFNHADRQARRCSILAAQHTRPQSVAIRQILGGAAFLLHNTRPQSVAIRQVLGGAAFLLHNPVTMARLPIYRECAEGMPLH